MRDSSVIDKTKLFRGLQDEIFASKMNEVTADIGIWLNQAVQDLSGYFEDPDTIPIVLGTGGLRYEHVFLQSNKNKTWIRDNLQLMLSEFRLARNTSPDMAFQTWASWMEAADRSISNVAVVAYLQDDLSKLLPEFMAKSLLRNIGDILEGSLQPLVRLRLDMQGVAGMRSRNARPVKSMSFGKVIEELISREVGGDMYIPSPLEVSVSQWRNIANHNSYEVRGNDITCTYGGPNNLKSISLPVVDLIDLAVYTNDLGFLHKVAYEIFSIDNMNKIMPYAPHIEITDHTKDGALAYGLAGAGFTILSASYKQGIWAFGLIDNFGRGEPEAKSALQSACITYMLLEGSIEIYAFVISGTSEFKISFKGRIPAESEENLLPSETAIRLDKYWKKLVPENKPKE